jgi:Flp pilus assembly protein TadG
MSIASVRHRVAIPWQKDRRGVAALEFGLIAPALFLLLFGGVEFGIVLNQYLTLTTATIAGATQFAFSAGVDATPYTDAVAAIETAAPGLTPLTITLSVNGTGCTSDAGCVTALAGATGYVTASASYSCSASNIVLNLLPNCTLMSQETERVQ